MKSVFPYLAFLGSLGFVTWGHILDVSHADISFLGSAVTDAIGIVLAFLAGCTAREINP